MRVRREGFGARSAGPTPACESAPLRRRRLSARPASAGRARESIRPPWRARPCGLGGRTRSGRPTIRFPWICIDIAGGVRCNVSPARAILLYLATSTNTWSCRNVICVRQVSLNVRQVSLKSIRKKSLTFAERRDNLHSPKADVNRIAAPLESPCEAHDPPRAEPTSRKPTSFATPELNRRLGTLLCRKPTDPP